MRIVQAVVKRFATTREKYFIRLLKPIVIVAGVFLFVIEILSLIAMQLRYKVEKITLLYW
jgi:hypothetical protein